jgi:hypothetical protein
MHKTLGSTRDLETFQFRPKKKKDRATAEEYEMIISSLTCIKVNARSQ